MSSEKFLSVSYNAHVLQTYNLQNSATKFFDFLSKILFITFCLSIKLHQALLTQSYTLCCFYALCGFLIMLIDIEMSIISVAHSSKIRTSAHMLLF